MMVKNKLNVNDNNNQENFKNADETLSDIVNNFSSGKPEPQIEGEQGNLNEITNLNKKINELTNVVSELKGQSSTNIDKALGRQNIDNLNETQMNDIKRIKNNLDQIEKLINLKTNQSQEKNYKRIPVLNSCVLEADGSSNNKSSNGIMPSVKLHIQQSNIKS